jgi:hypothetical protein
VALAVLRHAMGAWRVLTAAASHATLQGNTLAARRKARVVAGCFRSWAAPRARRRRVTVGYEATTFIAGTGN